MAAVVTEPDVRAAQAAVDAVDDLLASMDAGRWTVGQQKAVRGLLAAWSADVREAGYLEGVQRGRRDVGQLVRDTLEGEGL